MKPKFTMILMLLALGVQMVFAQQKTISGTVSDENGLPLPGATVLISGTSTGTSTDFDGKYQLTANVGDVLEISYVGYATQSVTVGASSTYDVQMQTDNTLDEVVVTGYTIVPGASFVSSWTTKENTNSIFELAFASDDALSSNSLQYIYRFPGDAPAGYGDVEVESSVINIFEATDVRRGILGYQDAGTRLRNMGKYPDTATGTDNIPLIRYEEVVLNYAEALFELNNADPMALTNLNLITSNRGASAYAAATKDNILLERRKELMFEGFRFDDMMRTGKDVVVLGSNQNVIETLTYPNDKFVYPIDIAEMDANSNMVQNAGY